jgi:hypothetical protein
MKKTDRKQLLYNKYPTFQINYRKRERVSALMSSYITHNGCLLCIGSGIFVNGCFVFIGSLLPLYRRFVKKRIILPAFWYYIFHKSPVHCAQFSYVLRLYTHKISPI